ncbi:Hypothetical protein SCF082_LOCUS5391 [Durusdinium trenchii]|uniref:Ubiquitin-like domain-containing protein n=1 Tax=Durusdinium trenchii TaxID=1381693 RepID=A0ABP0I5L5_9DINO
MGAAIHISPKRQVVYGDYYLPVTMGEDDSPQPSMHSMEVTFSLLSGQSLKLTLSRRDATVKAARQQIARLCCMPEQAVHLLNEGHVLEDEAFKLAICLGFPALVFGMVYRLVSGCSIQCLLALGQLQRSVKHVRPAYSDILPTLTMGLDQYRARIFRPLSNKEYILYDPASHTGAPGEAREMGCLRLRSKRRVGPSDLDFVMPKVREDGTAAQFRPLALKESISQIYERGSLEHLQILRGTSDVSIELRLHGEAIFEAHPMDKTWAVRFQHPLSHFQAFGILIGVLDNACLASFHK